MARWTKLILFVFFAFFSKGFGAIVQTPVGEIKGIEEQISVRGRIETVRKFLGIPYAEPATGDRRLAKPVPKARFSVPYQATAYGSSCYAINSFPAQNLTSEDCLFLNIFSPDRPLGTETFPVMVWIHGGAFTVGSSTTYKGEHLSVSGQVILVTINYRLAELGFLSTMDDVIPGNYGLWDQQLAIKWVHDNTAAFGGDPDRVTIFGESAGSASVVYQMLYPGNLGLFQRAICESGSATSPWARKTSTMATEAANEFAKEIGCSRQSSMELLQCLRTKSVAEIIATMNGNNKVPKEWTPVVDNHFLLDIPEKIMDGTSNANSAKDMFNSVDLQVGINNLDGAVLAGAWVYLLHKTDVTNLTVTKTEFEDILVPYYLDRALKKRTPAIVNELVISAYTDWSDPYDDTKRLKKLAEFNTDTEFRVPTIGVANDHAKNSRKSTYAYEFSVPVYPSHLSAIPKAIDGPNVANHVDELAFLFRGLNLVDPDAARKSMQLDVTKKAIVLRITEAMINMWTNFAKTGNPNEPVDTTSITNVIWPQYGAEENYLEITATMTSQSVRQRMGPKAVNLFNKLVPAVMKATQCSSCQPSSHSGIIFG